MSGMEQTWDWVGGTTYGNGTRALGSAEKYADEDNPYGDPGLEITAATFQAGVLVANLNSEGTSVLGTGTNSQMGAVDLTFGLLTTDAALAPPTITRTTIGDSTPDGALGTPAGGFIPNIASPTQPNQYGGVTTPSALPAAPSGYAAGLPSSEMGSTTSPGDVEIGLATNTLVGTGMVPGVRPGRTDSDIASGDS